MKTLPFHRDAKKDQVTVDCADGAVSVYSKCAYCIHCRGAHVAKRVMPTPQAQAYLDIGRGTAPDESLMNAALMFNTLIRDGSAIECDDDANEGYRSRYQR
jgi:hypothetical protein